MLVLSTVLLFNPVLVKTSDSDLSTALDVALKTNSDIYEVSLVKDTKPDVIPYNSVYDITSGIQPNLDPPPKKLELGVEIPVAPLPEPPTPEL